MCQAKQSIDIIGWELSLSLGLAYVADSLPKKKKASDLFNLFASAERSWITLEDVLLERASHGVKTRIMVWRHHIMSHLNRLLYMGDFTIEREVHVCCIFYNIVEIANQSSTTWYQGENVPY